MSTNVNVSVTIQDSPQQRAGWSHAVAVALTVVLVAYALGWLPWLVAAVALYAAARIG